MQWNSFVPRVPVEETSFAQWQVWRDLYMFVVLFSLRGFDIHFCIHTRSANKKDDEVVDGTSIYKLAGSYHSMRMLEVF